MSYPSRVGSMMTKTRLCSEKSDNDRAVYVRIKLRIVIYIILNIIQRFKGQNEMTGVALYVDSGG